MVILCSDLDEMVDVIARLVMRGLTFTADIRALRITLSGGY